MLSLDWKLSVTNLNLVEWLTICSYFLSAYLCTQAKNNWPSYNSKIDQRVTTFWKCVSVILVVLALSEILDIQKLITHIARQFSKASGWYDRRGEYQQKIILLVITITFSAFIYFSILFRKIIRQKLPALVGIAFLCGYIAVRLVSFHDVDSLLNMKVIGVELNGLIELASVFCIGSSAGLTAFRYRLLT